VIATGTPTLYGWLALWNTTSVANGSYTLQSLASYSGGVSGTSPSVTITVNNAPPITTVVLPSTGATWSGSQYLDATASSGVSEVQYELTGGSLSDQVIATATPTIVGWAAAWDTTSVPNGSYTLQSLASYLGGVSGMSPVVTINVNNPPPSTTILLPANGATVGYGDTLVMDAVASPGVTQVVFDAYDPLGPGVPFTVTATPTIYGWVGSIVATECGFGCVDSAPLQYVITSVASYSGGVSGTSPPILVNFLAEYQF
jgi:hypothetical protein